MIPAAATPAPVVPVPMRVTIEVLPGSLRRPGGTVHRTAAIVRCSPAKLAYIVNR